MEWSDSHIYRPYRLLYEEHNSHFLGAPSWVDRCTNMLITHLLQTLLRATTEVQTSGVKIKKILDWWDFIEEGALDLDPEFQ